MFRNGEKKALRNAILPDARNQCLIFIQLEQRQQISSERGTDILKTIREDLPSCETSRFGGGKTKENQCHPQTIELPGLEKNRWLPHR